MTWFRVLDQLVVPALMIFLLIGSLAGAALGCALALHPASALTFMRKMNRWVSTRKLTRGVELPRRWIRNSPWLGVFLVAGGAFAAYSLLTRLQIPRSALAVASPKFLAAVALETTRWLMAAGSVTAVVLGLLMLFAPRAVGSLEARLDRWYSTRQMIPPEGDRMRMPLDQLVEVYPAVSGWLIVGLSLLVAAALGLLAATRWGG